MPYVEHDVDIAVTSVRDIPEMARAVSAAVARDDLWTAREAVEVALYDAEKTLEALKRLQTAVHVRIAARAAR